MTGTTAGVAKLVYSSWGLKMAAFLARSTPPGIGYFFGRTVARWVCSLRNSEFVAAVRQNQAVIAAEGGSSASLDQAVQGVFRNSADSVYELYHYMSDPAALERLYCIDPSFQAVVDRLEFDRRGLLIAGLHMAGFDLGLRWLCRYKFKPLVLTMPNPQQGRQLELEGRRQMQMNAVPYSMNALRLAVRHLQEGGMVLSGIDHPVPPSHSMPNFFGQPALLPTEHIYLAVRARVPVVVVASRLEADGRYHIHASPLVEMDRYPSRAAELCRNAEKVLALAEGFIREAPQQWLIFQPVWSSTAGAAST